MKKTFHFLMLFFAISVVYAEQAGTRPVLPPAPKVVTGVADPVISLNGRWKFTLNPPKDFHKNSTDLSSWQEIAVPGECVMQGFNIKQDVEYPYKRQINIPADFAGKRIRLRFNGVYSYARVWIDGKFVRDHHGGFTTWDCDITELVTPGKPAWLTVGVTDRSDEISWGSAYAKHNIGGILGNVELIALPRTFLQRVNVKTSFDKNYANANLLISAAVRFDQAERAEIRFRLFSPDGREVLLDEPTLELKSSKENGLIQNTIRSPLKWTAESPWLYDLQAELFVDGRYAETVRTKVGFRQVERKGNELLVNGRPVKLRGVNRHNVHPLTGRSISAKMDETDVRLLKEANVNFVRTSHYPPSKAFLTACDKYGIYVEEENALCFVRTHGNFATQSDPAYADRYLGQFAEMIERDFNHPCVIMWSLGNESAWGDNLEQNWQYLKSVDPDRPVIFSYPRTIPAGKKRVDIFSFHYENWEEDLGKQSMSLPVLHDEYAHVACYDKEELNRDPNVRNFWGNSIKIFGDKINNTNGVLGAAIWGGIDEVFQVPLKEFERPENMGGFSIYGYGEWGIIDGWRRKKPEFWLTKKAYSPVRIENAPVAVAEAGLPIEIPVSNFFDFTNLKDVRIGWQYVGKSGVIENVNVPPHDVGVLRFPGLPWKDDTRLGITVTKGDLEIDRYEIPVFVRDRHPNKSSQAYNYYEGKRQFTPVSGPAPALGETEEVINVRGGNFSVNFEKSTGLIRNAIFKQDTLIVGGPFLSLTGAGLPGEWRADSVYAQNSDNEAMIIATGHQGQMPVTWRIKIDGAGRIAVEYKLGGDMSLLEAEQYARLLRQGLAELGLYFVLPSKIDRISWERNGLWSCYPPDHIGRNRGEAQKVRKEGRDKFGEKPEWPWALDMVNFFLNGPDAQSYGCTQDFRAMRENIWFFSAALENSPARVRVESDGSDAARVAVMADGRVKLVINNRWNYPDLGWGNYMNPPIHIYPGYGGNVSLRLTDNNDFQQVER